MYFSSCFHFVVPLFFCVRSVDGCELSRLLCLVGQRFPSSCNHLQPARQSDRCSGESFSKAATVFASFSFLCTVLRSVSSARTPANASGSPSASFRGRLSGQGARTRDTRMAFMASDLALCASVAPPWLDQSGVDRHARPGGQRRGPHAPCPDGHGLGNQGVSQGPDAGLPRASLDVRLGRNAICGGVAGAEDARRL